MSQKSTRQRTTATAARNPNPYAAPTAPAEPSRAGADVGEPRSAAIRFGRLSGAFKVASRQQGIWIVILLLTAILGFAANLGLTIALGILSAVVGTALASMSAPDAVLAIASLAMQAIVFLGATAVSAFLLGGLFRAACKQVRGERIAVGDLFGASSVFGQVVLATLLVELLTAIAIGAAVIPCAIAAVLLRDQIGAFAVWGAVVFAGIAFAVVTSRLMLAIPLVVDGRQRAVPAIRKSWTALHGRTLAAIVFHALAAILSVLGAILLGIGVLLTLPVYYVAVALVYQDFFLDETESAA